MMSPTQHLAQQLIARPSVTPEDAGCQDIINDRLAKIGFQSEHMRFGDVDNLWLRRGSASPLLVFAGHTDVVPPGPREHWDSDPFQPVVRDGFLYGRGAADMKGSIAAWVTACESFIEQYPEHAGSIALLITSDEEGPAVDGTVKVVESLRNRGEHIDWCIVGEPTSLETTGDVIKNGRRGSLSGHIRVLGIQGHVAYPEQVENPIHRAAPALAALAATHWDRGNEHFPPTTFQISNIRSGTGAENVVPGELEAWFNLRYSTELTEADIKSRIEDVLRQHELRFELNWTSSGNPFLTPAGELVSACREVIESITGAPPTLSTTGGTSDGRFIAPGGSQVVELGPVNATIHKINERVDVEGLNTLSLLYAGVLEKLLITKQQRK